VSSSFILPFEHNNHPKPQVIESNDFVVENWEIDFHFVCGCFDEGRKGSDK